jgi:hypothetical protein
MPISVTCSECSSTYRVPDEAAGKAIKCKKCGARVSVPAADAAGGDDLNFGASSSAESGGDAKAKKKPAGKGKLYAIIGGALAFVCCCCMLPAGGGGAFYMGWIPGLGGGKAKLEFEKKETLTAADPKTKFKLPIGNLEVEKPAKLYKVHFQQGDKYVIDLKADKQNDPRYDPYLALRDAAGKEIASNDDRGPGTFDSQIKYSPTNGGGMHTVVVTVLNEVPGDGMSFTLTVRKERP